MTSSEKLTVRPPGPRRADRLHFLSEVQPRWCPGCGCFAVLKALTAAYAEQGLARENLVTVSGIGCSARLPYYTSNFGFHTIHGRAPTVGMGIKLTNPELSVWLICGDGDALAIGGNHTMHLLRRNPDINLLLLNNQIYGLTKGQASPTSPLGQKTRSTPFGVEDTPVNPVNLALAAGATFVARVPDTDPAMMQKVFAAANAHRGVSFVEVMFNCVTFNDGAYDGIVGKQCREDHSVQLVPGLAMTYGGETRKVLTTHSGRILSQTLADDEPLPDNALIHKPGIIDVGLAQQLALMNPPELPCALGIFRQVQAPVYGLAETRA